MKKYLLFVNQAYSFAILRPLQDAIRRRGDQAAWFIAKMELFDQLQQDELHLKTIKEVSDFKPRAVFAPGNWVPHEFPGVKVQVFHGFGIEKKGHFKIRGLFDLYCTHGPLTTQAFKQAAHKKGYFEVVETGWPKVDSLFLNRKPKSSTGTQILYAPTFSPSLSSAQALAETIKELSLKHDWNWTIKFHPKMDSHTIELYRSICNKQLQVSMENDISKLMYDADVLISDTSSVVTEFLLLDKPVITFRNRQPGAHTVNIDKVEDLENTILKVLTNAKQYISEAKVFIDKMHPYRDGKSSERVLDATDAFIQRGQSHLKKKPLNLWRKYKISKRMRNYTATLK